MSRLPFHAAGNHSKGSDQNTISKVISSYTPTLNAFARMRTKKLLRFDWSGSDVLVVAMPETPGQQDLNIEGEITSIKSHFPNAVIKTSPSKDEVMAALRVSKIAHFACHGETVVGDPSQSALLLKHPDKDQIQRLTVRDVSSINLEFGAIAYLSACSTAENSTPGLMDEFIHVANSFQLAGFAHVIGGLWPVQDRISVALTDRFYQLLNEVDDEEFVHDAVANAFHNAITFVRERNPTNVIAWAPFIHIGP